MLFDHDADDVAVGALRAALFTAGAYDDNGNAEFGRGDTIDPDELLTAEDAEGLRADCADFVAHCLDEGILPAGIDSERLGGLFHLSRNGHGCGFFDAEDCAPFCRPLQDLARVWGEWELARDDHDTGEVFRDADGRFEVWP